MTLPRESPREEFVAESRLRSGSRICTVAASCSANDYCPNLSQIKSRAIRIHTRMHRMCARLWRCLRRESNDITIARGNAVGTRTKVPDECDECDEVFTRNLAVPTDKRSSSVLVVDSD